MSNFGSGQTPAVVAATTNEMIAGLVCGPLDLTLLNAIFKNICDTTELLTTEVARVDAEEDFLAAIGAFDVATGLIDFSMTSGTVLQLDAAPIINEALGLVTGAFVATALDYTDCAGDPIPAGSQVATKADLQAATLGTGFVPTTLNITGAGLVQGGGDLSADRVLTVVRAVEADIIGLSDNDVAVTPASLAFFREQFMPRAGSFTVNFNGATSGNVLFSNPFPVGVTPLIAIGDRSNRNGGDESDEEIWFTGVSNTGFTWNLSGDGPVATFNYVAARPY